MREENEKMRRVAEGMSVPEEKSNWLWERERERKKKEETGRNERMWSWYKTEPENVLMFQENSGMRGGKNISQPGSAQSEKQGLAFPGSCGIFCWVGWGGCESWRAQGEKHVILTAVFRLFIEILCYASLIWQHFIFPINHQDCSFFETCKCKQMWRNLLIL